MKKAELTYFDLDTVGTHLQEFENAKLNKAMNKMLVLKGEQETITQAMEKEGFSDITDVDEQVFYCGMETTLKRVNEMFKAQGMDLEFRLADMIEYTDYMLVKTNETPVSVAKKVHKIAGLPYRAPKKEKDLYAC